MSFEKRHFFEAIRGEAKRTSRAPVGSMGSDDPTEEGGSSSADGKLGGPTARDSGPRQLQTSQESGGSGASWVPRLRFLAPEVGEATQEVSEEGRGRVERLSSTVTSTSRDASVCSDGSVDSFEDGEEVSKRLSKDGSVTSTEEYLELQAAPTSAAGAVHPHPATLNASPRASPRTWSPRGPRGGFSSGQSSPSDKHKAASLPVLPMAAFAGSLPPPSPRAVPGASPRQRTLTQHRDLIEAHKRVLEPPLPRVRCQRGFCTG